MSNCVNCHNTDPADLPTEDQICPAVGYQSASVCVPVTVTPYARVGATITTCCGDPVVTPVTNNNGNNCGGTKNGSCIFTITQKICIAIPVEFGATATVKDTYVECLGAAADECPDCTEDDIVS